MRSTQGLRLRQEPDATVVAASGPRRRARGHDPIFRFCDLPRLVLGDGSCTMRQGRSALMQQALFPGAPANPGQAREVVTHLSHPIGPVTFLLFSTICPTQTSPLGVLVRLAIHTADGKSKQSIQNTPQSRIRRRVRRRASLIGARFLTLFYQSVDDR